MSKTKRFTGFLMMALSNQNPVSHETVTTFTKHPRNIHTTRYSSVVRRFSEHSNTLTDGHITEGKLNTFNQLKFPLTGDEPFLEARLNVHWFFENDDNMGI